MPKWAEGTMVIGIKKPRISVIGGKQDAGIKAHHVAGALESTNDDVFNFGL